MASESLDEVAPGSVGSGPLGQFHEEAARQSNILQGLRPASVALAGSHGGDGVHEEGGLLVEFGLGEVVAVDDVAGAASELGLAVLAVVAARRQTVTVTFDASGFRVHDPSGREHGGTWAAVNRVTAAPGRITLHEGDERRTHLIVPAGSDADLDAIAAAIGRHLDADRGYTAFL